MTAGVINRNPALGTSFRMEIPDFPTVNYFAQNCELPGLSMGGIDSPYKNNQGVLPSNRIDYDPWTFSFIVDEDYTNFRILFAWMKMFERGGGNVVGVFKDISLHLLTSNKTGGQKVTFFGAVPMTLSALSFDSGTIEPMPITCSATFRYQYYDFV